MRLLAALLFIGAMLTFSITGQAAADETCRCLNRDLQGHCTLSICEPAESGTSHHRSGSSGHGGASSSGPRVCEFEGRVISCTSEGGTWSDFVSAWCRPEIPQPSFDDPIWRGRLDGSIFVCVRPGFSGIPDPSQQFRRHLSAAQEAVDAVALAWRAVASMNLSAPALGMFPKPLGQDNSAMGYVGWPLWLWVEDPGPRSWGPITASASDEGFTVTATASVDRVEWDLGNGDVVVCGVGTKHPAHAIRGESSPDCGFVYEVEGIYTVTATAFWEVEWSAPSGSGELSLELARADEVLIGEVQVVNVPVGQR